jgi:hypothetical protein
VAGANLADLPASCLDPIPARFQHLINRIGADDVARRQVVADLALELERRNVRLKRMWC